MTKAISADTPAEASPARRAPNGPARELLDNLETQVKKGVKLSVSDAAQLADALETGQIASFSAKSPFASCLIPLLTALGWRGNIRALFESLPHFADSLDRTEFRNCLAHLHYKTVQSPANVADIDERLFPCIFVDRKGSPLVLLAREEDPQSGTPQVRVFDSADRKEKMLQDASLSGTAYFISSDFTTQTNKKKNTRPSENWVGDLFLRFKTTIKQLFAMTLVLNIFALLVPLFIMAIYDQVIPSKSSESLAYLTGGILFAILCEVILRFIRSRFVAYLGARVENIVTTATFKKLLSLPPTMTESSPIGSQVARLKEFDSIKGLFSGTLVNVILELPFVVIFLAIILILGGPLAYIPLVMMAVFGLVGFIMLPSMKRNVARSSRTKAERHGFLVESMSNLRTIKQTASEQAWLDRFRDLSAESAYSHFRTSQVSLLMQSLAQAIMMAAGVATVGFGVLRILNGDMSVGALIACMALVWRVLSPLQGLFLTLTRLEQTLNSVKQINLLMKINSEDDPSPSSLSTREFAGHIVMDRVSFRYRPNAEPALLGASFEVKPGEMLSIIGPNAAGKSTALKLLLTMSRPQAGQVILDGMDVRQINSITLRQAIAYVPQEAHFFHGTIAQNLRLSQPMATHEEMVEACIKANVIEEISNLTHGFETRIGDQSIQSLPSSFKQRLSLARAYLKKSPILLLDEPAKTLDFEGDTAFMRSLDAIKGQMTILMVSHRPSHIRMADKVLVLEDGMVRQFGTPAEVFPDL
ncbi:peptidase domain-containing ABC transporter [Paremcibacter congregatus]|uniref:Lantibiotic ABC transporter n=1 Tax=Paremcibacter congregatus TaxID=2043170 RepID=A0A2G4YUI7_9PROT|nr:peptidase domain-containing ABC transporter [Paremcibacter congregatus]PHZ85985.1 lantibiotic ABC transporter [Paremcibacter congregatus]QDE26951.1 ATP-binding cassette domain-containing protein [Paremcibacter congregatus]